MLSQLPRTQLAETVFPAIPDPNAALQLALQQQLQTSQLWTSKQLQETQFRQLANVWHHAVRSVPYYQQLYRDLASQHKDVLVPDRWSNVPITSRSALQQAGEALFSRAIPPTHGSVQTGTTSGSTGKPVRFLRTGLTQTFWQAFGMRDHLWHQRDFCQILGAIRWFPKGTAEAPLGVQNPDWGPIVAPLYPSAPSISLNVTATPEQQLNWLERHCPTYLVSFPSNLLALAAYAERSGRQLPPLREIRTVGETVTDLTRQRLQQAFATRITDIYTCEEAGYLALQCPNHEHYHVQSENVLLEIVDDEGHPCPIGQPGRVLLTTLHNFASPLLRYEIGDIAEFGEPCPCGRGLPVIKRVLGRTRNRLHLPNGQTVFPYLGEHGEITRTSGVRLYQFQCLQHSLNEIELRLVMERPLSQDEQQRVATQMQRNLGHPFPIRFSFPDDIPRRANGKFEEFVSTLG